MRGSPLIQSLAVFAFILALGFPLWRLTHEAESVSPVPPAAPALQAADAKKVHLHLTFLPPPEEFQVSSLGSPVWKETSPPQEIERELEISFPKEGVDLEFQIKWPAGKRCAARVELTAPDGRTLDQSIWGEGDTDQVLTFQ